MEEDIRQRGPRGAHALVGIVLAIGVTMAPWPAPTVGRMAGVAVWMAYWWVMEAVTIPVTSLLPLVLLPGLGILDVKTVSASYGKPTVFLFLGGFLLALGLQRSGLRRRLAFHIVRAVGSHPARLILGFMLASALLSMWLSNTASVMVMLPIALSGVQEAEEAGVATSTAAKLTAVRMLGVAYDADVGGMATLVGTPPNLVRIELQAELLPDLPPIAFGQWVLLGHFLSTVFLASDWFVLAKALLATDHVDVFGGAQAVGGAIGKLGPVRRDELPSGGGIAATALLWMTGAGLRLTQGLVVPGWREATGLVELGDGAVAVAAATVLFLLPSGDLPGAARIDWGAAKDVPWGILLLFGGGFALAAGFQQSGLSRGGRLGGLAGLPASGAARWRTAAAALPGPGARARSLAAPGAGSAAGCVRRRGRGCDGRGGRPPLGPGGRG